MGIEDQRLYAREEAFLVGEIKGEFVYIGDLSDRGMRIATAKNIIIEDELVSLSIRIPSNILSDVEIKGHVIWKKEKEGIYFFGIEFTNFEEINEGIQMIRDLNLLITNLRKNLLK